MSNTAIRNEQINSEIATVGDVLTADGAGGTSWEASAYALNIYNEIQIATGGATYYLMNVATANTVRVYINGIRQPVAEDDTNSDVVTFSVAPAVDETLIFDYEAEVT